MLADLLQLVYALKSILAIDRCFAAVPSPVLSIVKTPYFTIA
jgi:hypothetical protein